MVRAYIITNIEVQIMETFLKTGEKLPGFRQLKSRTKNIDPEMIRKQIALVKKFQNKLRG